MESKHIESLDNNLESSIITSAYIMYNSTQLDFNIYYFPISVLMTLDVAAELKLNQLITTPKAANSNLIYSWCKKLIFNTTLILL